MKKIKSPNIYIINFLKFSIGSFAGIIINLISTPITTRILTPDSFGIFSIFITALNLSNLIIITGMDQSLVRFYNSESDKNGLFWKSCLLPFINFIFFSLIILICYKEVSEFIFGYISLKLIIFFIILLLFSLLKSLIFVLVRMGEKNLKYSILNFSYELINFLTMLYYYYIYGDSFRILILSLLTTVILTLCMALCFEKENIFPITFKSKISFKELIIYGFPLILTMALTLIFQSADKIAIKYYSTFKELGIYTASFKIISILNIIQVIITSYWIPIAYKHYEKHGKDEFFFIRVNKIILVLMFFISGVLLLFLPILIKLLGKEYRSAIQVLPYLTLMPIFYTISETTVLGINFSKKTYYHIFISIIVSIINILGNFILVPKLGGKGAAISTGCAYIVFFILRTYFSNKFLRFSFFSKKTYAVFIFYLINISYITFYNMNIISYIVNILFIIILVILYFDDIISFNKEVNFNK